MSREKLSKILFPILLIVFAGVMVKQFVLSDDSSAKSATAGGTIAAPRAKNPNSATNRPSPRQQQKSAPTELEQGYRPLPLQVLKARPEVGKEPARNVFVYYVPPPPPPKVEPPPPPPPLIIHSVDPLSVFARTKGFTLRVLGVDLPEDAQIFVNGQPLKTTRVSGSELSTTVDRRMIAMPGQLQVMVKNSTGALYSNQLLINVQEPPAPTYKYIGRIDNLVYLQKEGDERLSARLGEMVEHRWRVTGVTNDNVVLEDVTLGIPYAIAMEDRNPSVASAGAQPMGDYPIPVQRFPQRRVQKVTPQGVIQPQPEPNPSEEEEP